MVVKSVSFTAEQPSETVEFKTFPRKALKPALVEPGPDNTINKESPVSSPKRSKISPVNLDQTVMNIYNRFVVISDVDYEACISHLAAGNCPDLLVRYSVLNTLLKILPLSSDIHFSDVDTVLSTRQCIELVDRAGADFFKLASAQNVLELSTLQQIMRCVESIWGHFGWESQEFKNSMQKFSQKCIHLIGDRPNSKILVSSAIRLANIALSEQMLNNEQAGSLITSLSQAQVLNTAGFTADAVTALYAISRLYPSTILSNRDDWVNLALRGLSSNFATIRSNSYSILSTFNHDMIGILNESTDKSRKDLGAAAARNVAFKLAGLSQISSLDDVIVIIKSILMILDQSAGLQTQWPHQDAWVDALHICLKRHPKIIPVIWQNVLNSKLKGDNYYAILFAPFVIMKNNSSALIGVGNSNNANSSAALDSTVYTMLLDVIHSIDLNESKAWEHLMEPLLKTLATNRDYNAAAAWAHAVSQQGMILKENLIASYLDVFDTISRYANRHDMEHLKTIWGSIVSACRNRTEAMELVKYHYRVLSPEPPGLPNSEKDTSTEKYSPETSPTKISPSKSRKTQYSPSRVPSRDALHQMSSPVRSPTRSSPAKGLLSSSRSTEVSNDITKKNKAIYGFALADGLIKLLDKDILVARPKRKQFSLLTLILLPVLSFLNAEQRFDYLDRLVALNPYLEEVPKEANGSISLFMQALLWTIEAGSDNQPEKWLNCCVTIEDFINSSDKYSSQMLFYETLAAFVPIMKKAEKPQWNAWSKVMVQLADNDCRNKVLSKVPSQLPLLGLQCIVNLPNDDTSSGLEKTNNHKIRIIMGSLDEFNIEIVKKELSSTDLVDNLVRALVQQKTLKHISFAWKLIPNNRAFIVAKSLLSVIDETGNADLVEFWNNTVSNALPKSCPPFLSSYVATRLSKEKPRLNIPQFIIMNKGKNTPLELKRPLPSTLETPPSSNSKRMRRPILTGSLPMSLSTPPASDNMDDIPSNVSEDLSSSPPPRSFKSKISPSRPNSILGGSSIPKDPQEKARMLKRLLMGLNMADAVQSMKPSEQLMIYNMLFKSCVSLKTHIASNSELKSEAEVEKARAELADTISTHNALIERENQMIANGIVKRNTEREDSESDSDLGSDKADEEEEDDVEEGEEEEEEYLPNVKIKLEV